MVTREEILERLKTDEVQVGYQTFFFAAIPERKTRFVVAVFVNGDGVASRTENIEKLEEDGTYTMKFRNIPVAPADHRELPESGYDVENPILTLEGGTRLRGSVTGGTLSNTIIYWDQPEV